MAEKGFCVKELNLIGQSGTPTIESLGSSLDLKADTVGISTDLTVGRNVTATGSLTADTVSDSGGNIRYKYLEIRFFFSGLDYFLQAF